VQGQVAVHIVGGAVLLTFVGALAELNAKRHAPQATLRGQRRLNRQPTTAASPTGTIASSHHQGDTSPAPSSPPSDV
jgi:hypothetical protein